MGNQTNIDNWAARERLRAIERAAYWRGWVQRRELVDLFGLSLAQASADMQAYQEINPGALHYNLRAKRYEGDHKMVCKLHVPCLEDAMNLFLKGGSEVRPLGFTNRPDGSHEDAVAKVASVPIPERVVSPDVTRRVFLAVLENWKLKIHYASVSGNQETWRWVAPRAFVFDGSRWHVRAWCFERAEYRDFVLGRMSSAGWPEPFTETLDGDEDWETMETITVRPHSALSADAQRALAMDFGMEGGVLRMKVRRAVRWYALRQFGLREKGMPKDQERFELVE